MSYCTRCDSYKPLDDFAVAKNGPNGRNWYCKSCINDYGQRYKDERRLRSKRKYGISEKEYLALFDAQGGVCAICGKPETKINRGTLSILSVDHNHETGKVRGLLCSACNAGLGNFRDDRELIAKALEYLRDRDDERTTNARADVVDRYAQGDQIMRELDMVIKGLPKQLSGNHSDADNLPLFSLS